MSSQRNTNPELLVVGALATNCWVFPFEEGAAGGAAAKDAPGGGCILIDPGADGAVIISRLERLGLVPRTIVLTHGHFDHVAALGQVVTHFREAHGIEPCIAIHGEDASSLGPDSLEVHRESFMAVAGDTGYIDALWEPLPSPTMLLGEGAIIGPFTVLHLPGHSKGSVGLYDEERKVLVSGDVLFNGGIGRADLPGGDFHILTQSLNRLFLMPEEIRVYPGHGGITSIGAERYEY